jgi:hypothetical protein
VTAPEGEARAIKRIAAALNVYEDPNVRAIAQDCKVPQRRVRELVDELHTRRCRAALGGVKATTVDTQPDWLAGATHWDPVIRRMTARAQSIIRTIEARLEAEMGDDRAVWVWPDCGRACSIKGKGSHRRIHRGAA